LHSRVGPFMPLHFSFWSSCKEAACEQLSGCWLCESYPPGNWIAPTIRLPMNTATAGGARGIENT
jgi:hypothetical protein